MKCHLCNDTAFTGQNLCFLHCVLWEVWIDEHGHKILDDYRKPWETYQEVTEKYREVFRKMFQEWIILTFKTHERAKEWAGRQ